MRVVVLLSAQPQKSPKVREGEALKLAWLPEGLARWLGQPHKNLLEFSWKKFHFEVGEHISSCATFPSRRSSVTGSFSITYGK